MIEQERREAARKPEKLSDEEMGNLLAAIGNHEAKALTLLVMSGGRVFTRPELHRSLMQAQGSMPGWRQNITTPFAYCIDSLAPIGLVTKEYLNSDMSTFGYQITERGENLGVPLAGLFLDFAERRHVALQQLFGGTASSKGAVREEASLHGEGMEFKMRAPFTRMKIIHELVTRPGEDVRLADIEESIGTESAMLGKHMELLKAGGFIEYASRQANQSFSLLRLSDDRKEGDPPIFRHQPYNTKLIWEIIQEQKGRSFTVKEVKELLKERYPEMGEYVYKGVSSVLAHFRRYGYLKEQGEFRFGKQSEIYLTAEQREVLEEISEILYSYQLQDAEIMARGKRLAGNIISHPGKVAYLMSQARGASSYINRVSPEILEARIRSYLGAFPGGLKNKEIQTLLEEDGTLIGIATVREYTHDLEKSGKIEVSLEGNVKRYRLKK